MLDQKRIQEAFESVYRGVFPKLSKEEYDGLKTTYDRYGRTIFHHAARDFKLPKDFKDWHLRDSDGLTVGHFLIQLSPPKSFYESWRNGECGNDKSYHDAIVEAKTIPADHPHWDVENYQGENLASVALLNGVLPKDFSQWSLPDSFSGGSIALAALNKGFFKGREQEALLLETFEGQLLAHEVAAEVGGDKKLDELGFKDWSLKNKDGDSVLHLCHRMEEIPKSVSKSDLLTKNKWGHSAARYCLNELASMAVQNYGETEGRERAFDKFISDAGSKLIDRDDLAGLSPVQQAVFITNTVKAIENGADLDSQRLREEALQFRNWKEADQHVLPQFKWLPHISSGPDDASVKIQEFLDGQRPSLVPGGLRGVNPREFQKKAYEGICDRYGVEPYEAARVSVKDESRPIFGPGSERQAGDRALDAERAIAEKLSRVFGKDIEKAVRYIENHPANIQNAINYEQMNWTALSPQKKLHDAELSLPKGEYRKEEWAGFLAKNPSAGRFLADADAHDKKYDSLPNGVNELKSRMNMIGYGEIGEQNPALAKMAADLGVSKNNFDRMVKLMPHAKKEALLPDIALIGEDELSGFRVRLLEKGDPKALVIGMEDLSSCCQSLGSVGEAAAIHSFTQPCSGVYVIENTKTGELVAQTWAWLSHVCNDQQTIVFDSVESKFNDESMTKITQAMLLELAVEMKKDGFRTVMSKTSYGMTKDVAKGMGFKPGDMVAAPQIMFPCSYMDCQPYSKAHGMDNVVESELKVRTHHTSRVGRDIEKLPAIHLVKWDKRQDDIQVKKTVKGFKAEIAFTKEGDDVLIKVRAGNKEGLIANEVRRVHIAEKGVTWTQAKEIEDYKAAAIRMIERRASLPEAQRTKLMTSIAEKLQPTESKAAKEEGRFGSRFSRAPEVREERPPERERRAPSRAM